MCFGVGVGFLGQFALENSRFLLKYLIRFAFASGGVFYFTVCSFCGFGFRFQWLGQGSEGVGGVEWVVCWVHELVRILCSTH